MPTLAFEVPATAATLKPRAAARLSVPVTAAVTPS